MGLALSVLLGERIPASSWSLAPLLALTVPLWLMLVALLVLYWLRRSWRVALLPLAALVLAWPQVQRGLPLHLGSAAQAELAKEARHSSHALSTEYQAPTLRLLSYNVRIFNVYPQLRRLDPAAPAKAIKWLATSPADVLCLQEYYQEPPGAPSADGKLFQVGERLGAGSGRHVFVSKTLTNSIGAEFGLAIFSRLPIVGRGEISFGRLTQNHAMWVDVVGPARGDTVRIFNTHLQSMSLDEGDIVAAGSSRAGFKSKGRSLLGRFVRGAAARAWQADTLLAHVRRSPYPVLLAGDLNDLPYSYAYSQLASELQNAWATVGFGPGNTYHGRLPPLLRIDQQFAGPQWRVLDCRIHSEIPYADHFPVEGLYQLATKADLQSASK
ncbi:endonuclease/exonuclease/phosphatase family protein [Hymenobacter sp. BT559]|uniref:endonuclease/exonuclease/phosphatase family protein n=1 Tax=Hymenobacter sp. BT559 TaxID=2795729 RepID=UPI0018EB92B9|nr:endonuclease/exonuclease/phosphatase family protein [Hymenobacter sp. BT559]MBJ6143789.1 endonuclease/exonuclease/phosphatase family protein [Hymenobacter sp. BT559]